jgi:hypothetical protein
VNRIPRKKKKQMTRIPLEFNQLEWQWIKESAKSKNMKPSEFIVYALEKAAERIEKDDNSTR